MMRFWEARVGLALIVFAIALFVGCAITGPRVAAWDDEDCKAVDYQHPDCQTPSPSPTSSPSATPTKSPTPSSTLIPPATTTPRPPLPTCPSNLPPPLVGCIATPLPSATATPIPTSPAKTPAPTPSSSPTVLRLPNTATAPDAVPYDPGWPD